MFNIAVPLLAILFLSNFSYAAPYRPKDTNYNLGESTISVIYNDGSKENYISKYRSHLYLSLFDSGDGCKYTIKMTAYRKITFITRGGVAFPHDKEQPIHTDNSFSGIKSGKDCFGGSESQWTGAYDRAKQNLELKNKNFKRDDTQGVINNLISSNVSKIIYNGKLVYTN